MTLTFFSLLSFSSVSPLSLSTRPEMPLSIFNPASHEDAESNSILNSSPDPRLTCATTSDDQIPTLSNPQFNQQNHLFTNSLNPTMDLIVTLHNDSQQQSSTNTPAAANPTGLSATQMAARQRMIAMQAAKRGGKVGANGGGSAFGGKDSRGTNSSPPLRGEAIRIEIWRLTEKPSRVAHNLVNPPEIWEDHDGKRPQEREEMEIDDLVWSPDGEFACNERESHKCWSGQDRRK